MHTLDGATTPSLRPHRIRDTTMTVPQVQCFFDGSLLFRRYVSVFFIVAIASAALSVVSSAPAATSDDGVVSVCQVPGCNCTPAASPYWTIVNCTFNHSQVVQLEQGSIPDNIMELSVIGGEKLELHSQSFANLPSLARIRVDGTKKLIIKKGAFLLASDSILLQVYGCDQLFLDTNAFKSIKGPLTAEISKCAHVTIKQATFSYLLAGKFQDIKRLELCEDAFNFDRSINIRGVYEPVTTLLFHTTLIPNIPKNTFHSTLAEIKFENSEVRDIQSEAFRANTITRVMIVNSSLHRIRSGAFHESTLIESFTISKSKIHLIEGDALMGACNNLTVQHSNITEIHTGAINITIARVVITDNVIEDFHSHGFIFNNWNRINFDNNFLLKLHRRPLDVPISGNVKNFEFTFNSNYLYTLEDRALVFLSDLGENQNVDLRFDDNYFNKSCHCDIAAWLKHILGTNDSVGYVLNTSFCNVDDLLNRCFKLPVGIINMNNFTKLVCGTEEVIKCEPYHGETKIVNSVTTKFTGEQDNNNKMIISFVIGFFVLAAISGTLIILLVRGGLWLKRNGYCQRLRNLRYHHNEVISTEAEDIMVTIPEKIPEEETETVPEELTQELLQTLREKLEDPMTYNEAREMIERLYDHFIVEDSYTNNNRQEDEAHLYEELGNLAPPTAGREELDKNSNRPFSFLRLIEERFNLLPSDQEPDELLHRAEPAMLVSDYAEPTDAEVHLYSELLQAKKQDDCQNGQGGSSTTNSHRSNASSGKMAFRPLPAKPKGDNDPGEGPSTKY